MRQREPWEEETSGPHQKKTTGTNANGWRLSWAIYPRWAQGGCCGACSLANSCDTRGVTKASGMSGVEARPPRQVLETPGA